MSIRLDNISKHFGQFQALAPLSLKIEDGEMIGLLGVIWFRQNHITAYYS